MDKKELRYAILKEVDKGNLLLDEKFFKVDQKTFDNQVNFLVEEGYLKGLFKGDGRLWFNEHKVRLTEDGEDYLSRNSESNEVTRIKEVNNLLNGEVKTFGPFLANHFYLRLNTKESKETNRELSISKIDEDNYACWAKEISGTDREKYKVNAYESSAQSEEEAKDELVRKIINLID